MYTCHNLFLAGSGLSSGQQSVPVDMSNFIPPPFETGPGSSASNTVGTGAAVGASGTAGGMDLATLNAFGSSLTVDGRDVSANNAFGHSASLDGFDASMNTFGGTASIDGSDATMTDAFGGTVSMDGSDMTANNALGSSVTMDGSDATFTNAFGMSTAVDGQEMSMEFGAASFDLSATDAVGAAALMNNIGANNAWHNAGQSVAVGNANLAVGNSVGGAVKMDGFDATVINANGQTATIDGTDATVNTALGSSASFDGKDISVDVSKLDIIASVASGGNTNAAFRGNSRETTTNEAAGSSVSSGKQGASSVNTAKATGLAGGNAINPSGLSGLPSMDAQSASTVLRKAKRQTLDAPIVPSGGGLKWMNEILSKQNIEMHSTVTQLNKTATPSIHNTLDALSAINDKLHLTETNSAANVNIANAMGEFFGHIYAGILYNGTCTHI